MRLLLGHLPPALVAMALIAGALPAGPASAASSAASALQLEQPAEAKYGTERTISGRLTPAGAVVGVDLELGGSVVASTQTSADGSFVFHIRLISPGPYIARTVDAASAPLTIPIRPVLHTSVEGRRIVGQELLLRTTLQPASAGRLRLTAIHRSGKKIKRTFRAGRPLALPTSKIASYVAWVTLEPNPGYRTVSRKVRFAVGAPPLHSGSRGRSVRLLERELAAHRFALSRVDGLFGYDTLEAVYALQKLAGLPRTGSMNAATWLALERARPPEPRQGGDYVEVDKSKQVLYVVRGGKVFLIVAVSTGATGNTPIGLFHVYSKVPGGAVMYYSNYFIGAFAIHGYVDVPPYPASHGCVRVPMWAAIRLYGLIPMHSRVLIRY